MSPSLSPLLPLDSSTAPFSSESYSFLPSHFVLTAGATRVQDPASSLAKVDILGSPLVRLSFGVLNLNPYRVREKPTEVV